MPWSTRGRGPTVEEAGELAAGFQLAHHEHGLSQAGVQDLALRTLSRADATKNPVRYVIGAFERSRLERLRPAGEYEPLAEQPLPLPEESTSAPKSASTDTGSATGQRITIVQDTGEESAESAKTPSADPSQHMALIRESLQRRRAEQARQNQRSA